MEIKYHTGFSKIPKPSEIPIWIPVLKFKDQKPLQFSCSTLKKNLSFISGRKQEAKDMVTYRFILLLTEIQLPLNL